MTYGSNGCARAAPAAALTLARAWRGDGPGALAFACCALHTYLAAGGKPTVVLNELLLLLPTGLVVTQNNARYWLGLTHTPYKESRC